MNKAIAAIRKHLHNAERTAKHGRYWHVRLKAEGRADAYRVALRMMEKDRSHG